MTQPQAPTPAPYHLVGVGGVGMSGLAQALLAAGFQVSGSDRTYDTAALPSGAPGRGLDVFTKLQAAGVSLSPQDGEGVVENTRALVVSSAIEDDNPDLVKARALEVPVLHRAECLARLAADKTLVAVSGSSGKSTVTGMLGWILDQAGFDPTVVNGGMVVNWQSSEDIGNIRRGNSELWIVEADESDKSLLTFEPDWAIITNVSKDHFELDETHELFDQFRRRVKNDIIEGSDILRGFTPELLPGGARFQYGGQDMELAIPGRHNAENAFLAVALAEKLGVPLTSAQNALRSFRGIHRRFETVGLGHGARVVDDYAHNPAKITATWSTAAMMARRVIGVWRPHGYGPLKTMMNELAAAFAQVGRTNDLLYLLPVYDAGGTANRTVSSEMLAERLKDKPGTVSCIDDPWSLPALLSTEVTEGDIVVVMGARDPELPLLARRILEAIQASH